MLYREWEHDMQYCVFCASCSGDFYRRGCSPVSFCGGQTAASKTMARAAYCHAMPVPEADTGEKFTEAVLAWQTPQLKFFCD